MPILSFGIKEKIKNKLILKYFNTKEFTLLIMDRARSYFSDDITTMFENHNANFILIPLGLTSMLQPLDTHVNKSFKNNVRNEYHRWLLNNKSDNITDSIVLDFIYNSWYNINKIKKKN